MVDRAAQLAVERGVRLPSAFVVPEDYVVEGVADIIVCVIVVRGGVNIDSPADADHTVVGELDGV
jgi:hypothetical protein